MMKEKYKPLFQPLKLGRMTLKNRIAMAPMGIEYMTDDRGNLNRRVVDFYTERIKGEAGLIICSVFKAENRIEHLEENSPMIREESLNYLGELCDTAHSYGARIFIQLTAGFGRVTPPDTLRGPCVSASETDNFFDPSLKCRALTGEEIHGIAEAMGDTALLLVKAGVDGVELHGHEGYLFDQFTTPLWNKRTDEYGGSLENRMRFPLECLAAIRNKTGDRLTVSYRFGLKHYLKSPQQGALPGEEFAEAGRDIPEGLQMARMLEEAGFDLLHVDAGCYESHYWPHPPHYQKHGCMTSMASQVRKVVNIPVIGVGRLDKPEVAAEAVASGDLDIAAIGRGFLADPDWADRVRYGDEGNIRPCVGCYDGCLEAYSTYRNPSCAVNPAAGRERAFRLEKTDRPRKVLIAGAGIAGMEAARVAALRGHKVTLYEKNETPGGIVNQAAVPEFKKDLRRLLTWYEGQLSRLGIEINYGVEVDADFVKKKSPDVTLIATGSRPFVPPIPGVDGKECMTAIQALKGEKVIGDHPVIAGGGLAGCEIAIWLARQGKRPTIVEALPDILSGGAAVPMEVAMMARDLLKTAGVAIAAGWKLTCIKEGTAELENSEGERKTLRTDTVILSLGMRPVNGLARQLDKAGLRYYTIGDCREPKNVMHAVWDGFQIGRSL